MPETPLSNATRKRASVARASRWASVMRARVFSFSRQVVTAAAAAASTKPAWTPAHSQGLPWCEKTVREASAPPTPCSRAT